MESSACDPAGATAGKKQRRQSWDILKHAEMQTKSAYHLYGKPENSGKNSNGTVL